MKKLISVILVICLALSLSPMVFASSMRGDIDGDNKVTSSDALAVLMYSVGKSNTIDKSKADLNGDGQINSADALIILQICVGLIFSEPVTKDGIIDLYNSALKKAYYKESLTIDKTHYDKGKIENLTEKTSENFNDDYSQKLTFHNGVTASGTLSVDSFAPGCNVDPKGVASATISATSSGYKITVKLSAETTNIFDYPVYNMQAFGFAYVSNLEMTIKSGTAKYTGTVFVLEIDKNGNAKNLEARMPYVCDYVAVIGGKTYNMRDTGEEYFYGKLVY